jgi:hypothetical protein
MAKERGHFNDRKKNVILNLSSKRFFISQKENFNDQKDKFNKFNANKDFR